MANRTSVMSPRSAARVAGFGYLAIGVLGIFANFFVLEGLIESGDAAATADNIAASEGLFRLGIASLVLVAVLDVVIGLALYVLLGPVHKSLALLAAGFRLVYAAIFGAALVFLVLAVQLLEGSDYLAAIEPDQLHVQMMVFLDGFGYGWLIGLVWFGAHLLVLGYLLITSGYLPRILGILLMVAGAGYLVDSFANLLLSNYDDYETLFLIVVAVPSVIAEFAFAFWLLLRAGDVLSRDDRTPVSA
jgi:hypothetical protein